MNPAVNFTELLTLRRPPVAMQFKDAAPDGIERIEKAAVSGCTYWHIAAQGRKFYTEAADHFGCAIGAHTHGVEMPASVAAELQGMIGTMVELQYIENAEVPSIPTRNGNFGVAIYGPLETFEESPDAVLFSGSARQMMLLAEAAHASGIACDSSMVGRPTCSAIPAVMRTGLSATNLGCIGNRVYTGLGDEELYFVVAGSQLGALGEKLAVIVNANVQLEQFHQNRKAG
jgi:uncharacterized protein (DUF169 family)